MVFFFFFQAEDGIRDAQESRGLGDVYKRQAKNLGVDESVMWGEFFFVEALTKVVVPHASQ